MDHERNLKFFYTYILKNAEKDSFYIGYTSDLRKRLLEHKNGKSTYTKYRGPFDLVYYEACLNREDARSRELYLKSGRGRRYLTSRLKRFLFRT